MDLKEKLSFRRHKFFSAPRRNTEQLRRSAFTFSRFLVLSVLSFFSGIYVYRSFGSPFTELYAKRLIPLFSATFDGVLTPHEYVYRILFYASPFLVEAALLILSLIAKDKQRALFLLLGAVQFFQGLNNPIASKLLKSGLLHTASAFSVGICRLTTALISILLCIYAYRLSLCFSLGFPNRKPAPGTTLRFVSFTARLLLWIILLVLLSAVTASI